MIKWRNLILSEEKNDINTTAGCSSLTFWYEMFYKKLASTGKNKTFNLLSGANMRLQHLRDQIAFLMAHWTQLATKVSQNDLPNIFLKKWEEGRHSVFPHTLCFVQQSNSCTQNGRQASGSSIVGRIYNIHSEKHCDKSFCVGFHPEKVTELQKPTFTWLSCSCSTMQSQACGDSAKEHSCAK